MKTNIALRAFFKEMLVLAEQEGLDLTTDSVVYQMTYPEHPGVLVTVKIGGMFLEDIEYDEELDGELH